MSYNITGLKIQSIDLAFPIDFDFRAWLKRRPIVYPDGNENVGRRECLKEEKCRIWIDLPGKAWHLPLWDEYQSLSGSIRDNLLIVEKVYLRHDFSNELYHDVLLPLFEEFRGDLHALVIWENGDTIDQVTITEGVVEEKEL